MEIGQGGSETHAPRQHVCQTKFKLAPAEKTEPLTDTAGMPFKLPYLASLKIRN